VKSGPPKPRPWPAGETASLSAPDAERLTAPLAWRLYTASLGYHVPTQLENAAILSQGLKLVR